MRIALDSTLRQSGDAIEDYKISLRSPYKRLSRIRLLAADVPKTLYQFTVAGLTESLEFEFGGVAKTLTFSGPTSFSTGGALATWLGTEFNAVSGVTGVSFAFDTLTGKLTLTAGSNVEFTTIPTVVSILTGYTVTGTASMSLEAANTVDLSWPRFLYLAVRFDDADVNGDWTATNASRQGHRYSFKIPMDVDFGAIKHYTEGSEWPQAEPPTRGNQDTNHLHVKWYYPEDVALADGAFNGVQHQLVFRFA